MCKKSSKLSARNLRAVLLKIRQLDYTVKYVYSLATELSQCQHLWTKHRLNISDPAFFNCTSLRNPFLQIIATIGDEDEVEQPPPPPGAQQQRPGKVQLGKFWPQAPYAWFAAAELKFEVANITSERECFAMR